MTTLQTLSSRSSPSAQAASESAQPAGQGASSAPSFNQVLETTLDDQLLSSSEADDLSNASDPDDQVDQQDDSSSDENESEAGKSGSESDALNGSSEDSENASSTSQGSTVDTDGITASSRLNSAAELSGLLRNAATVNLANIATQQLEEQSSQSPQQATQAKADQQSAPAHSQQQTQAATQSQSDPLQGGIHTSTQKQSADLLQTQSVRANEAAGATQAIKAVESSPAQSNTLNTPVSQQAQLQPSATIDLGRHWQGTHTQITQAAQVAVQHSAASTRVSENRLQAEPAVSAVKAVDSASASSTNSGAGHAGFDLGTRSQNQASLIHSKPADDSALQRQQVIAQVQRGLASVLKTSGGSMKIRLSPEHLGEINIQLMTSNGSVKVDIQAERSEAHAMLKDSVAQLRQSMEARGIQIDDLNIQSPARNDFDRLVDQQAVTDSQRDQHDSDPKENHQQHSKEHNDPDPASPLESGSQDIEMPRGIWTDLGLDAIA